MNLKVFINRCVNEILLGPIQRFRRSCVIYRTQDISNDHLLSLEIAYQFSDTQNGTFIPNEQYLYMCMYLALFENLGFFFPCQVPISRIAIEPFMTTM